MCLRSLSTNHQATNLLKTALGASVRSIMKGKYSIPAYVASAVLGAVALMAFYESPISPLPVPALPEPPVGRFPPEMPVISPNLPVPFRMNQQQQQYGQQNGYGNQRSFQTGAGSQAAPGQPQQQQQQQQVLFPGATAQPAQQRQGSPSPGPVQQLAANLISSVGANRPAAQRKSGPDSDPATLRSFFGSSAQLNTNKLGAPANQQHKQAGSSLLSFLGFGGPSSASGSAVQAQSGMGGNGASSMQTPMGAGAGASFGDVHRASSSSGSLMSSGTHHELGTGLSNSHLVNKMKSYFDRPVPHNSWSMDNNVPNQYDQYRRMSIIQALAKDTAFISSFFSPSRRASSNATGAAAAGNPIQQSINAMLSNVAGGASGSGAAGAPTPTRQVASSRMQTDPIVPALSSLMSPSYAPQSAASHTTTSGQTTPKRASSGYGLMRAADKVAHVLFDTFAAGLLHRSSSSSDSTSSKKALEERQQQQQQQQQQQNAIASATSILSDIMSSYNAAQQASANEMGNAEQQQQQASASQTDSANGKQQQAGVGEQATGRSADSTTSAADKQPAVEQSSSSAQAAPQQQAKAQSTQSSAAAAAPEQQALNRKVRSIGFEYPMEAAAQQAQSQQQHQQHQQQKQQPSRATQINDLVDYVSDSYQENKLLFSFVMNQVGLSKALPYVEQFLGNPNESRGHSFIS
jgi:hypothetical protein